MTIRDMLLDDCPSVVDIHLRTFNGFFLSFLGRQFLVELYTGILKDASGLAYVYEDSTHIMGFVAGIQQPVGFYHRMLCHRWWRFGIAALKPMVRKPVIIPRLMRVFTINRHITTEEGRGTLMSIAVNPADQRKGVGKALVDTFLKASIQSGLKKVDLTTDKNQNEAVNNFYQSLGFSLERSFTTPEGREMNEYLYYL